MSGWCRYFACWNPQSFLSFALSFSNCHNCYFTGALPSEQYDSSYVLRLSPRAASPVYVGNKLYYSI
jgi:hypothetical protein